MRGLDSSLWEISSWVFPLATGHAEHPVSDQDSRGVAAGAVERRPSRILTDAVCGAGEPESSLRHAYSVTRTDYYVGSSLLFMHHEISKLCGNGALRICTSADQACGDFDCPGTVAPSLMPGGWSDPQMVLNFRRDVVNSARKLNSDPRRPVKASQAKAGLQRILLLDSRAWGATRGAPFQFVRWTSALATVVVSWVQSSTLQSAAAYVPALAVVALLLLPDAQSIEIPGLKFDRLTNELARQRRSVDRLSAEVSLINNSLIASSQVNITIGPGTADAAGVAAAAQSAHPPQQPASPSAPAPQQRSSGRPRAKGHSGLSRGDRRPVAADCQPPAPVSQVKAPRRPMTTQ
jgi:hypothetical protein